jgi:hypothetical protein
VALASVSASGSYKIHTAPHPTSVKTSNPIQITLMGINFPAYKPFLQNGIIENSDASQRQTNFLSARV